MSEWTPGPWYQTQQATDEPIEMFSEQGPRYVAALTFIESADARLIALAPEMAELLATIARLDDGSLELVMTTAGLAAKARALLARARGET